MRKIAKKLFYEILCPALCKVGIDKLLRKVSKNRNLIIMYHGVSKTKHFDINGRHLPTEQFERQLLYFKKNFDIVSLETICEIKRKGHRVKKNTIALTFDDGFLNNVQNAKPLLEKYQVPATIFICGISLVDRNYIHPSDLIDLVRLSSNGKLIIGEERFVKRGNHLIHSETGLDANSYVNTLTFGKWTDFFASLRATCDQLKIIEKIDDEVYFLISAEALRQLDSAPLIGIGSHSYQHVDLRNLTDDEIQRQVLFSKETLEKYSNKPVDAIAFPYGSYDEEVIRISQQAGYKYLIAGGDVQKKYKDSVFPRIGILSGATYSFNILSVNRGFKKFGF